MKTLHLSLVGQRPNQHPLPAEQGQHLPTGMLSTLSLPDHDRRAGQGNVRPHKVRISIGVLTIGGVELAAKIGRQRINP